MRPSAALEKNRETIKRIVEQHRGYNARIFGSVVNGSDSEASDLDILIDPMPDMTFFDIGAMRHELMDHLGVSVDVLTPKSLPAQIRTDVLKSSRPI